jgi:large subunit ribosomal protein L9
MKVLLLKDVFKLGRAGDVKKVADGYGRNYLIPQGLAVLATEGALKRAEYIRKRAAEERARLNQELSAVAERIGGLQLTFAVKAGETGKLYGSITPAMIAEAIREQTGAQVDRRQIDAQPIKLLGVHKASVRLTMDLIPEVTIIVHREGESPESVMEAPVQEVPVEEFADLQAQLDAEEAAAEEGEALEAGSAVAQLQPEEKQEQVQEGAEEQDAGDEG